MGFPAIASTTRPPLGFSTKFAPPQRPALPNPQFPKRTASFLPFSFDFRFSRFARHFRSDLLVSLKTYNRELKTTPSARRQTIYVRKPPAPSAKSAIIPDQRHGHRPSDLFTS